MRRTLPYNDFKMLCVGVQGMEGVGLLDHCSDFGFYIGGDKNPLQGFHQMRDMLGFVLKESPCGVATKDEKKKGKLESDFMQRR